MKSLKKSLLVFLVACPTILGFSCLGDTFWRIMWDSAVDGAGDWVEGTTFGFLDDNIDLSGSGDSAQ